MIGQPTQTRGNLAQEFKSLGSEIASEIDRPVTLPPGRASEATRPLPIGSPDVAKTIGMTDVACFAASDCGSARVE